MFSGTVGQKKVMNSMDDCRYIFSRAVVLVSLLVISACGKKEPVESSSVTNEITSLDIARQHDGRFILKSTGQPFTGVQKENWPDATLKIEFSYKDGWRAGRSRAWHENGRLGMEGVWQAGQPVGVVKEWSPDGLLMRTMEYRDGKKISDVAGPSLLAQEQIDRKLKEREVLDGQEWKAEVDAQDYERTFVRLWDRLRETKNDWLVWQEFPFKEIAIPTLKDGVKRKHQLEVEETVWTNNATQSYGFSQWKEQLQRWSKSYLIKETEWHQQEFDANEKGKRSLFKFTIHATSLKDASRYILRGALRVYWSGNRDSGGRWLPGRLEVESLKGLQREGVVPFESVGVLKARRDNPQFTRERVPDSVDPSPLLVRDLDGDWLPEIIPTGSNLIYWNQGAMKFKPEPMLSGGRGQFPDAAAIADFTSDGLPDLLTFGPDEKPMVFRGNNAGRFEVPPIVSLKGMRTNLSNPSAVAAGDVDGDGDLDVFVPQYLNPYAAGRAPAPYYNALDGLPAYLLINDGTGKFTDGTVAANLTEKRNRRTYSASFVDLDNDKDLDLVVVSDFSGLDLYLNDGAGGFTDITDRLGDDHYSFGMSHAFADYNQDDLMDIYMVGMGSTTARRLEHLKLGRKGFEPVQAARMKMGYGNRLLLGDGKGGFKQAPYNDSLARTGWAWGCTSWDFDNDGDRDLYIANGHISGTSAKDYCTKFWRHDIYTPKIKTQSVVMAGVFKECQADLGKTESWNGFEHNVLYLNEGEGLYTNISFLMGLSNEADCRSVVSADLDLDGRPDLLVVEKEPGDDRTRDGQIRLIRNTMATENSWIGVHLKGRGNKPVWGAIVTVKQGGKKQSLPVVSGDSWKAQHPATVHFGLGKKGPVNEVTVRWSDGSITQLKAPSINSYHTVKAGK